MFLRSKITVYIVSDFQSYRAVDERHQHSM